MKAQTDAENLVDDAGVDIILVDAGTDDVH